MGWSRKTSEEGTFEEEPEVIEGESIGLSGHIWERVFQAEGKASAKALGCPSMGVFEEQHWGRGGLVGAKEGARGKVLVMRAEWSPGARPPGLGATAVFWVVFQV